MLKLIMAYKYTNTPDSSNHSYEVLFNSMYNHVKNDVLQIMQTFNGYEAAI